MRSVGWMEQGGLFYSKYNMINVINPRVCLKSLGAGVFFMLNHVLREKYSCHVIEDYFFDGKKSTSYRQQTYLHLKQ